MNLMRKILLLVGVSLACTAIVTIVAATSVSGETGTRGVLIAIGLLGLLITAAAGWTLGRGIIKPLQDVRFAMHQASDKLDFTTRLDVHSSDEIGQITQAFNQLAERMRKSFSDMQQSTAQMLDITEEADRSSRKIARNSQIQSDASTNMAASVQQMTVSISMVASQAKDASSHTEESRDIADQSSSIILTTLTGIQTISESVREAAARIKALRDDCNSISSVANIIREIAEQTNLLALNAAIEAARAGEQGRGFAVVADEVRKLAERTAKSTQEITELLGRMQESAKLAVSSMSSTEIAVDEGVANARTAGESIERIKDGSIAAAAVVEEISGAIREQQSASTNIAQSIEKIAQMSEQNSASASASAAAITRMATMSQDIARALATFRVDANAVQKVELRVADIQSADFPTVKALKSMSDALRERTNGRIVLKIYSDGSFGSEKEAIEQVRSGALDMARVNISPLNKPCPETIIPTLPFLFRSVDHMQRAMDGKPGDEILASCVSDGYLGLAFYDSGVRSVYANKPIRSMADLRGVRLRIPQSDLWIAVANAMGATPTPMSIDEVIAGQQMGLIDAAENNLLAYESFKHYQVFQQFSATEHSMAPDVLIFSKKTWDSLSEEDQRIVRECARQSVPVMRRYWAERENATRKTLSAAGTIFISSVDKKPFQDAMRPVYDRFVTTDRQRSLLRAIREMS